MPTKNTTLGPGMLYIDDIKIPVLQPLVELGDDIPDDPVAADLFGAPAITLSKPHSFEFETTNTSFNEGLLAAMAQLPDPQPFSMEFDGFRYEQIRKHKKKRINKKWAKRYGYRAVPCRYRMDNCYIHQEMYDDWREE